MIHELRIYTLGPGQAPAFLKLVKELGMAIRGNDYGTLEGYWYTEFGQLNQVVHLWSHADLNARQDNRARLSENQDWTGTFIPQALAMVRHQEVRLMHPQRPLKAPASEGNIYEYRYYRAQTGKGPQFIAGMSEAMPARERHSQNVGLWLTETGEPNEVSHMWVYADFNARMAARGNAMADPDWQTFLKQAPGWLKEMRNLALIPASFSPLK